MVQLSVSNFVEPIYSGQVGQDILRFFRSPVSDDRPDLPWVSLDDVVRTIPITSADRVSVRNGLVRSLPGLAHVAPTVPGATVLVPIALIALIPEQAFPDARTFDALVGQYALHSARALLSLSCFLTPSEIARAIDRWSGFFNSSGVP